MAASRIVPKPISGQIADHLRQSILAGEFAAWTPLRECDLAERYQVSRHPIRKVLQQLTQEGLLIAKPNCGVTVADDSSEHVGPLLTPMRVMLEVYALRQASPARLQEHRPEWEKVIRRMKRAADERDEHAILSLDAEFHQGLLLAAGMEDCVPLWLAIYGRMRGHHRQGNRRLEQLSFVPRVHERLLESIVSGETERSVRDLTSHLENTEFNQKLFAAWRREMRRGTAGSPSTTQ